MRPDEPSDWLARVKGLVQEAGGGGGREGQRWEGRGQRGAREGGRGRSQRGALRSAASDANEEKTGETCARPPPWKRAARRGAGGNASGLPACQPPARPFSSSEPAPAVVAFGSWQHQAAPPSRAQLSGAERERTRPRPGLSAGGQLARAHAAGPEGTPAPADRRRALEFITTRRGQGGGGGPAVPTVRLTARGRCRTARRLGPGPGRKRRGPGAGLAARAPSRSSFRVLSAELGRVGGTWLREALGVVCGVTGNGEAFQALVVPALTSHSETQPPFRSIFLVVDSEAQRSIATTVPRCPGHSHTPSSRDLLSQPLPTSGNPLTLLSHRGKGASSTEPS